MITRFLSFLFFFLFIHQVSYAEDLMDLTLHELMKLEVTTASKQKQSIQNVPSAIYVVTRDMIRNSGALSVPDALRLVPGVEVAQTNSSQFAITIRGFNGRFANKLLVMIDGRRVYTELYSGTFWESLNVMMDDIERIEVIRGPGGSLWGANAINGIINIITKSSKDTEGGYVFAGAGNLDLGFAGARYGNHIGDNTTFRVYSQFHNKNNNYMRGAVANDDWYRGLFGFRIDSDLSESDTLFVSSNVNYTKLDETVTFTQFAAPFTSTTTHNIPQTSIDITSSWDHEFSAGTEFKLQGDFMHFEVDEISAIDLTTNTFDINAQQSSVLPLRQNLMLGAGYRLYSDSIVNSDNVLFTPSDSTKHLFSFFIRDEIRIIEDKLTLALGSKFEHNQYTGFEVQPNASLLYKLKPNLSFWVSGTRAVKTPSRLLTDLRFNTIFPAGTFIPGNTMNEVVSVFGSNALSSEEHYSAEFGMRTSIADRVNIDLAAFYNIIDNATTWESGTPYVETAFGSTHIVLPQTFDDRLEGRSFGFEISSRFKLTEAWHIEANYSYINVDLNVEAGSTDATAATANDDSPAHRFNVWSNVSFSDKFDLNLGLRFVDDAPNINIGRYFVADLRFAWHALETLDVELIAKNLLDWHHYEYPAQNIDYQQTEIPTSLTGKVTWRFK